MGKDTKQKNKKVDVPIKKIKVKVIGVGNGAGSIVADIVSSVKRAKFLVANTDRLALSKIRRKVEIFQFGQDITGGFGTGMDVSFGQLAAEKEIEKIKTVLKNCDLCILIACLGGGTGSGAAPIFAKTSKELGNLTYGIFTLPFNFEGEKKLEIAKESLKKLRPFVNAVTIVPNERIFNIVDKRVPLKQALSAINKILAFSLEGLIETIYNPGIINIDFADLKTVLKGQGLLSYLSRAEARGEGRAKKVLQKVLSSPLYPYNISKAKRVLFNIAGPSNLSISEVAEISQGISDSVKRESKIIFGVSRRNEKEKIEISLLAVGCAMKSNVTKEKVRKNALQVKKAVEELEKEIRKKEEVWETPAFLRKK